MQIVSGSGNLLLSEQIAKNIGGELLKSDIGKFASGELKVQIHGHIKSEVTIIHFSNLTVNDNLLELLLIADTLKRAGAIKIKAVVPYLAYSRQDKHTYKNGPISAGLVARLIETAGITEIVTIDLHSSQIEGFFNIKIANLSTESLFFPVLEKKSDIIIVSPDIGGITRAKDYCSLTGAELAIINKTRDPNGKVSCGNNSLNNIQGKNCVIIDDIVDSASTLCLAADQLVKNGAKSVIALVTHGIFSGNALLNIEKSAIEKVYISDSIVQTRNHSKISILSSQGLISAYLKL